MNAMLNIHQAAEYLGVSEDKLRDYARTKVVPTFKLGAGEGCSWRFSKAALDKWMEAMSKPARRKRRAA